MTAFDGRRRIPAGCIMRGIGFAIVAFVLAACDGGFLGADDEKKLPGTRVSVLRLEQSLKPDPELADTKIKLPTPVQNSDWPMAGGTPQHALHHVVANTGLKLAWSKDIGNGSSDNQRLIAAPITGGGRVYVMDSESMVSALDNRDGSKIWQISLVPEDEDEGVIGGGLAYFGEVLYVTTGYGQVFALEANSGTEKWVYKLGPPIRSAPAISGGRIFVISHDNQLHTLNANDGRMLWTYIGLPEITGIIGSSSPAVQGGIVVAPFASGELVALRVENGRPIWAEQLVKSRGLTPLSSINAIRALPVIDDNRVYAINHSGRMAAVDLRTGRRAWVRNISGVQTPWLAGEYIYLVTTQGEVICISRANGRIVWLQQLERFQDPEDLEGPINWSGPVLASDQLLLVSSEGEAVTISPYDGQINGRLSLPSSVKIGPVVADGTFYVLTDNGDLIAYR